MLEFIEERGWGIFNEVIQGDEEGEFTFTNGRGSMVIDYTSIIGDIEVRDRILKMTVKDRVDSDHQPVEVWLEREMRGKRKESKGRKCWRRVWNEEGRTEFKKKVGRLKIRGRKLEDWEIMEEKVKRVKEEIERERGEEKGKKRG